jgi:putative transposase
MSRRTSPATDQVYGLQRVTRIWGVSRATVYRHRRPMELAVRKKPGPLGPMADEALVAAIRQLLEDSPFHGEGYRKLWARLRFSGIRTSRRRVLRLMREHGPWPTSVPAARMARAPTTARSPPSRST